MNSVQCPIDRVCWSWLFFSARLSWSSHQHLFLWSPVHGLPFPFPFLSAMNCFSFESSLWSLKNFFRDSLLMLLFYFLPLRSRTFGDIRSLQGIFLALEECPRNCSKTGIAQVFDLWPCEEQHSGGFGKRSGDPHLLNLNHFYIFWDVIMQKKCTLHTIHLTSWFPQVDRLQYCDWVERDNSNKNALVWKIFPLILFYSSTSLFP